MAEAAITVSAISSARESFPPWASRWRACLCIIGWLPLDVYNAQAPIYFGPPSIPDSWSGTLEEFFESYVAPWWPSPERMASWTEAAIGWHERPESLLLIRGRGMPGVPLKVAAPL
jgi:hypothetical protein